MATKRYLILDLATAPIDDVDSYIETPTAPSNYKDPAKIDAYIAEERASRIQKAGLDIDLCRITGAGWKFTVNNLEEVFVAHTEDEELDILHRLGQIIAYSNQDGTRLIGFNSLRFDWPLIMRRCAYLKLPIPVINTDRYRSEHVDLYDRLTYHGTVGGHGLGWYAKRLSLGLVKPLSGAAEAHVLVTGEWEALEASIRHDVAATEAVAKWLGIL